MKNRIYALIVLMCLFFILPACSNPTIATEGAKSNEEGSIHQDGSVFEYPVSILTYNIDGEEVITTYEQAPKRVIAVEQPAIEMLLALGLEDTIVASFGLRDDIEETFEQTWGIDLEKINYLGSLLDLHVLGKEALEELKPDLIFSPASCFNEIWMGEAEHWADMGVNLYSQSNGRPGSFPSLENECQDVLNVGRMFGVEDRAGVIVDEIRNEIAFVKTARGDQESLRVAVLDVTLDLIGNITYNYLIGDMVVQLGATLLDPEIYHVSDEDLIAFDPDVILLPFDLVMSEEEMQEHVSSFLASPNYDQLKAVKSGRVFALDTRYTSLGVTRCIETLRIVARCLYPELYGE